MLNIVTIPVQTTIAQRCPITNDRGVKYRSRIGSQSYYHQLIIYVTDVANIAAISPVCILWKCLLVAKVLKNDRATSNRMVDNVIRPYYAYAPRYFDHFFVLSKSEEVWQGMSRTSVIWRCVACLTWRQILCQLSKMRQRSPLDTWYGLHCEKHGLRSD